jgi:serine/threonine protein kinase
MFEEFMDGGTLTEFIYQFKDHYTESLIAYVLEQVLLGLAHLHGLNHIHRDMKSDNILLDRQGQVPTSSTLSRSRSAISDTPRS